MQATRRRPKRLRELQEIAAELAATKQEPERLGLTQPGEYGLFTILRAHADATDEGVLADCARRMVAHLRSNGSLPGAGAARSAAGCASSNRCSPSPGIHPYAQLGFDPRDADPPFLKPAVSELAKADGTG